MLVFDLTIFIWMYFFGNFYIWKHSIFNPRYLDIPKNKKHRAELQYTKQYRYFCNLPPIPQKKIIRFFFSKMSKTIQNTDIRNSSSSAKELMSSESGSDDNSSSGNNDLSLHLSDLIAELAKNGNFELHTAPLR